MCVKNRVFVFKEREQGCPTIGDPVCDDNKGIATIEVFTLGNLRKYVQKTTQNHMPDKLSICQLWAIFLLYMSYLI